MVLDEAFKLSARDEVLQPDIRKTGIHPNFWYPVARSDNVKTGKPHGVSFAGEPIVLVRTECCSCPDFVDNKNSLFARCIFGNLFIEPGTPERLAIEERLASLSQFKGPYKRSKFRSYLEVKKRGGRRLAHRNCAGDRADRPTRRETDADWNDRGSISARRTIRLTGVATILWRLGPDSCSTRWFFPHHATRSSRRTERPVFYRTDTGAGPPTSVWERAWDG